MRRKEKNDFIVEVDDFKRYPSRHRKQLGKNEDIYLMRTRRNGHYSAEIGRKKQRVEVEEDEEEEADFEEENDDDEEVPVEDDDDSESEEDEESESEGDFQISRVLKRKIVSGQSHTDALLRDSMDINTKGPPGLTLSCTPFCSKPDIEREKQIQAELERLKGLPESDGEEILDDSDSEVFTMGSPKGVKLPKKIPLKESQQKKMLMRAITNEPENIPHNGNKPAQNLQATNGSTASNNSPPTPTAVAQQLHLQPGAVVWARYNDFPSWPSVVITVEEARKEIGDPLPSSIPVRRLGCFSNVCNYVDVFTIEPFSLNVNKYTAENITKELTEDFKLAKEEAMAYDTRPSSSSKGSKTKFGKKSSGRINRPRLGEIPEVEGKKVSCGKMTGRVIGATIKCDHCSQLFGVNKFEFHAGKELARNPYKTIFVTESGKPLNFYRYCTYCLTRETPWWESGPYGKRTLCKACGIKWKNGVIKRENFLHIEVGAASAECRKPLAVPRAPSEKQVLAISLFDMKDFTLEKFTFYVLNLRQPVVLQNCTNDLDLSIWSLDYLMQKYGDRETSVRYMETNPLDNSQFGIIKDSEKTVKWFLENAENPNFSSDPDYGTECLTPGFAALIYAKDFSFSEIVPEWKTDLLNHLPTFLHPWGPTDLLGSPPEPVRPLVWMGYVGAEGTRTPLHVDKLATIAFNLHVCGEGIKEWWLVDSKAGFDLANLISKEGGNLYKDTFWMAPEELEGTGLKMWHHKQKKGEMLIVPPMVPHTVINRGKLSCAVAANILHETAAKDAWDSLLINRTINRTSIYRLKNCIYFSVKKEIARFYANEPVEYVKLGKLLYVLAEIVSEESTALGVPQLIEEDEYFLCDRCSCDIFNRRYHCPECMTDDYDLCVLCYHEVGTDHCHKMELFEKIQLSCLQELLSNGNNVCEELKKREGVS